jgi:hypothetical protein
LICYHDRQNVPPQKKGDFKPEKDEAVITSQLNYAYKNMWLSITNILNSIKASKYVVVLQTERI